MNNHSEHLIVLFQQIAGGSELAFEELFHLYVPQIKPLIHRIIKTEGPEKDIIQEVFLGIWLGREKLLTVELPHNWIFKIVYHRCYTWLQRQGVQEKISQALPVGDYSNFTEENIHFSETISLVQQAIHLLPPQAQRIYLLSRETDLKVAEIANRLALSEQTVKNSLVRSRKAIRQYLIGHGILLPLVLLGAGAAYY
ncbi:MAG TPA: sigma-70 family RNA polymerase sigma factor [Chitinophaga sp.]|uniref:RNA polymerase sigma factor n=1 Tax=Chitinophaga sp. TaxID=1869181 RepID=UPI002C0F47D0|nr:sigma-70 family RNA polymerase sigma factor [Chitinophaga sp.]HVI48233.1 sigma-70 family RNA polymerase sigma factor [Chitinophaga sp.]